LNPATPIQTIIAVMMVVAWQASGLRAQASAAVKAIDTKGTPDQRADQLIAEMTLSEKIALLGGGNPGYTTAAIPRLGIGSYVMNDGPAGVYGPPAGMAMPCGAALAATWDPAMAALYGHTLGSDARVRGVNFQLGPGVNICRVALNGRNFEYFGEDPYLASVMAMNWTKACSAMHVIPTIKHFAANNQETDRQSVDSEVDDRTLHEIYFPAFKKAVQESGIVAVMCAYNRLNGHYASNNRWLLTTTLKDTWGFKGFVMSDWGASHDVTDLAMGLDLEMPGPPRNLTAEKVTAALTAGAVKLSDVDDAVHRVLRSEIAQGWMDAGWELQDTSKPIDNPESAAAALQIAQAGVVLLKNDHHTLPLDRATIKTIVVVGPNATAPAVGNERRGEGDDVSGPINSGGGGSGLIALNPVREAEADYLKSISQAAGNRVKVIYLPMPADKLTVSELTEIKGADAVIICVGLNNRVETEGSDHPFELPLMQQHLALACGAANPRTIVINNSGAGIGMTSWLPSVGAVLQAWYLGQEGGVAISKVLFDDYDPSGRLVDTFDKHFEDAPAYSYYPGQRQAGSSYRVEPYTEGIFVGYRGYDKVGKNPMFPFGYGLSYTTFDLSNLKIEKSGPEVHVSLNVTNTGQRAGAEVVQVYIGEQGCPIPRPLRELKGFDKVMLKPGETKRVSIVLPRDSFAYWSPDKKDWTVDSGKTFTIEAGVDERDIKLQGAITVR
jgi:beta-glucosidase